MASTKARLLKHDFPVPGITCQLDAPSKPVEKKADIATAVAVIRIAVISDR